MDDYNLDTNREERLGFPEVVYGSSKSVDLLRRILNEYQTQSRNALATRVQPEKGQALLEYFPMLTTTQYPSAFCYRPMISTTRMLALEY